MSTETLVNINDKSVQSMTSFPILTTAVVTLNKEDKWSMETSQHVPITVASGTLFTEVIFQHGDFPEGMETDSYHISDTVVNITSYKHQLTSYPNTNVFVAVTGEFEIEVPTNTHRISGTTSHGAKIIVLDAITSERVTTKEVAAGAYSVDVPGDTVDVIAKKTNADEVLGHGNVEPIEI